VVTRRAAALPLLRSRWSNARWLVLAPHADDETIGAGALIADAASRGAFAGAAFLTDSSGSHDRPDAIGRRRLAAIRRQEASAALRRLAPGGPQPVFLSWPDAAPWAEGDLAFDAAVRRLRALCRTRKVDALAVTAGHEPHCDHEAACRLAYAVARAARRPLDVFEYVVWADQPPGPSHRAFRTPARPTGPRRMALAAHRSQLTPLHGPGFRLPLRHLASPATDILYLRRWPHAA
jgi:LmbE family N-acetylglucosaminyl deacetylase